MFTIDTYIGNMMQRNVVGGMQEYLGEALSKCNISISAPISVTIITNKLYFLIKWVLIFFFKFTVRNPCLWLSGYSVYQLCISSHNMSVSIVIDKRIFLHPGV